MIYRKAIKVSDICQLMDKSKYPATHTQLGCTFTNNDDGSFTVNGTIATGGSWSDSLQHITQNLYNHKVLLFVNSTSDIVRGEMKFILQDGSSKWGAYNSIYTVQYDNYRYISIRIYMDGVDAGKTIDNVMVTLQFFDLTEMYGQGNEPTTVEEFKNRWYKNLCDWSRLLELPLDSSHANVGFYQVVVSVEPNTAYTLSRATGDVVTIPNRVCYLGMDNEDKNAHASNCWLNHNAIPSYCRKSITLTSDSDGKLWIFFSRSVYDVYEAGENIFGYLQLEKGTTATSYVPYTPNPAPYRPYCFIDSRKKTVKVSDYLQLLDKSKYPATVTRDGITFTNNGDGTIVVNGTNTGSKGNKYALQTVNLIGGHKYYINSGSGQVGAWGTILLTINNSTGGTSYHQDGNLFTQSTSLTDAVTYFYVGENAVIDNITFKPQLFDLTEMYGSGNEPSSVEEFKTKFSNDYYAYTPYSSIYSLVSTVKVSDYCQFFDKSYPADVTRDGITFTNNGDGSVTINGTTTTTVFSKEVCRFNIIKGHKYYVSGVNDTAATTYRLRIFNCTPADCYKPSIITANMSIETGAYLQVSANRTVDNVVVTPQFFDLTEMYGAGNEPNTVDEFTNRWYKNLFDISKVLNETGRKVDGKNITVTIYGASMGLLKDICPSIKAGDTVTISFKLKSYTSEITKPNFLRVQNTILNFSNLTFTVTEEGLNQPLYLYKSNFYQREKDCRAVYTDFQIEIGSTATDYVSYVPNPAPYKPHVFI